jgi:chromosome segregation protein
LYLSRLEILGFKSFAQKTVVNFNQGVTSIVGPNGCGKTNIVDAIRWSLGEQKSNTLRSDKMENVIFNGTQNKKPMGMAEVSLTIINNKGILPTEYAEVTITRRIFRSGESEYLLNKNLCRLKDITNLFMDTGMGTNAYSVIELKMVETILSSKADERRIMFEEAAGVNKYKLRRRLALKKLDEVKADLNRVNDIVTEVEKKVASLERQAKKADKYNRITTTLRELEMDLAEHEFAMYNIKSLEYKERKEESAKERLLIDSELAKLTDELKDLKEKLNATEIQLKEKRGEIQRCTEKVYNLQRNISVSEERKRSLNNNIVRYEQELEELKYQQEENETTIEENKEFILDVERRLEAKNNEKQELNDKVQLHKTEFEDKKNQLKEFSDSIFVRFKEINNKENELKNISNALNNANKATAKFNDAIKDLTGQTAKTVGYIEELNNEKTDIDNKLTEAEALYTQKQKEKEDLEKELNALREKELSDKGAISNLKDKISFIQSLIDNLEGISKGAKILVESNVWTEGEKTLIANIGNAQNDYRTAIEAALKNNLNNILVETFEDVKNGIEYLKQNDAGKASFYINRADESKKTLLQKINNYSAKKKIKAIVKEEGIIGAAKDLIITEDKWKSFFENFLSRTFIVDTVETAFKLASKYKEFNFAALNGDFISSTGVIEAGAPPKLDDTIFGRKQLLINLKDEFPQREKALAELRAEIETVEERLGEIDLKVLSEKGKILVNDLANVEKQIAQFEFEMKKSLDEVEKNRKLVQDSASESNILDNKKNKLADELELLLQQRKEAEEEQAKYEAEFKVLEEEYNGFITALNKLNIDIERLNGEKKNTENSSDRAASTVENIKKSIIKREEDISSAHEELETIDNILDEKRIELDEVQQLKSKLTAEETEIDTVYKGQKKEISELETKQKDLRENRDRLLQMIHTAEMSLNEIRMKSDNLIQSIKENYSVQLELKTFEDLEQFDFKNKADEVHQLKQQVKGLGPINLLAYSEYEEEKQRLDFLHKQRDDLLDSEKDIVRTIEEINTTAQQLFTETFEKIRNHFINIFRGLFNPGDEADLRLEENTDPLEGKIEIIAKPKGKRPTGIELLSGGEKTLTAIALLFAIYLVKPSPFCILDEIDAPLDDANVDRFTRIIKDFSKDTQFIVVTHNKRTMEAASTLYGVTMQEEGVSKLVSVRFNEDFDFVQ